MNMGRDSCLKSVAKGVGLGSAIGGAVGAVYGSYEAIRIVSKFDLKFPQVPGLPKIRHVGRTTFGSAAVFGLFLGAGSLIHCGKSY